MNNPNPFVPKGSLLEQQSARRSRLKLGVFCVLAVSVTGLVAMLIQGCKREQPADTTMSGVDTNPAVVTDTNAMGASSIDTSNYASAYAPSAPATNTIPAPVIPPPVVEPVAMPGSEYTVVKGDTLGSISKSHHVTVKEIEAANPGVDSKHLKIGKKLVIPASTKTADTTVSASSTAPTADAGSELYTIKSGDTLDKIAKAHHTTAKAIQAANNLTTTKILVGHKLKIPASASAAPVAPTAPVDTTSAPVYPPMSTPAPTPVK